MAAQLKLDTRAKVLKLVLSDPSIVRTLSPEAHQTALIFWRDFEKSAIDLSPEQRQKFVTLSSEIMVLGREFLEGVNAPRMPASIKPSELAGLKDKGLGVRLQLQARFTQRDLLVYPGSVQAHMIMRAAPEEEPRKRVFIAANSSTPQQIGVLEDLLRKRAELARLVGRESYAHMTLDDKMAKNPRAFILYSPLFCRLIATQIMYDIFLTLLWTIRDHSHGNHWRLSVYENKHIIKCRRYPSFKHGTGTFTAHQSLQHHQYLCPHLLLAQFLWAFRDSFSIYMAYPSDLLFLHQEKSGIRMFRN